MVNNLDAMQLQEELIDVERRYESAVRDIESVSEMLEQERQINANVVAASKEDSVKMTILNNTNRKLEADLRELRMQLSTQRGRLMTRNNDEDNHKALLNQKNVEINKFIEEVTNLGAVNEALTNDLEEVTNELQAAMEEIDTRDEEIKTLNKFLEESNLKCQELSEERDSLRERVEDFTDNLEKERNRHQTLIDGIESDLDYYRNQCKLLESNRIDTETKLRGLSSKFGKHNQEVNFLETLQSEISSKDKEIKKLKAGLESMTKDFEILALDWDKMDKESKSKNPNREELVKKFKSTALSQDEKEQLMQRIEHMNKLQKKDRDQLDEIKKSVIEKEKEILELRINIEKFENGSYGMKEALAEIKTWRARHSLSEKHVAEYVERIADLESQGADLAEENIALRDKLQIPFTSLNLSNFKNSKLIELEKTKVLVFTLQNEIEKLEEERIELKSKLR